MLCHMTFITCNNTYMRELDVLFVQSSVISLNKRDEVNQNMVYGIDIIKYP